MRIRYPVLEFYIESPAYQSSLVASRVTKLTAKTVDDGVVNDSISTSDNSKEGGI